MTEARPATVLVSTATATILNCDVDWDSFDSVEYRDHNYRAVRDDDRKIVHIIRDFFATAGIREGRGVDVGPGANLYPSLALLPFCKSIDLREYSASNVKWLETQKESYDANWDGFWEIYRENPAYAALADPRTRYREVVDVRQENVFKLPPAAWDLGTMFFVSCSLSTDMTEFEVATRRFVRSLTPGAPFATAFMEHSTGYPVGDYWFPAVPVGKDDVARALDSVARPDLEIIEIDTAHQLRENVGMLVAIGYAAG